MTATDREIRKLSDEYAEKTGTSPFVGVEHRGVTNSLYMFTDENFTNDQQAIGYMRQLVSEYAERVNAHCLHAQFRCRGNCSCFCRICIPPT
jgi:hypothetical protein